MRFKFNHVLFFFFSSIYNFQQIKIKNLEIEELDKKKNLSFTEKYL